MNSLSKTLSQKHIQVSYVEKSTQAYFVQDSQKCYHSSFFQDPAETNAMIWIPNIEQEESNVLKMSSECEVYSQQSLISVQDALKDCEIPSTNQICQEPKFIYSPQLTSVKSLVLKKKQRRNNLIKFIMRTFGKCLGDHKNVYENLKEYKKVQSKVKKFKEQLKERRNANITLAQLSNFFGSGNIKKDQCIGNRKVLQAIVKKNMKKEIIANNQIKQKALYLTTMKVYKLRACSIKLCDRIEC